MSAEELKAKYRAIAIEKYGESVITDLEKKHQGMSIIVVEDKMAIFKKPDRKILSSANSFVSADPIKYLEIIAENCYLLGDRDLIDNDDYFFPIMPSLNSLIENKKVELVKL